MGALWRDFRYGLRMLARNKGFTAVAVLALALGIGPNVAMFSIIWATFLAPMPYPKPEQLVVVWTMVNGERSPTRADDYVQFRTQSKTLRCLDFSSWSVHHLTNPDHSEDESGGLPVTSFNCMAPVGSMFLGRGLRPDDGTPGKDHVVELTHLLWQEHFHSDLHIVGKSISINDQPYTVVGVEQAGPADRTGVTFYVPFAISPGIHARDWGTMIGRLQPGATIAQAQADISLINQRLAATRPGNLPKQSWTISVEPLRNDWMDKKLQRNLWMMLAAVGFVLLIACANLANLLLARGSSRQQELAVRSALGATRRQVFIQLLTESLTLAISGGVIGIALGWALMKLTMAIAPNLGSSEAVVQMNTPVLCFALGASVLAGVLSGCAPAMQAARLNLSETLKQGSRSITGRGRMKTQRLLVMGEFALSITLLAGAGMALHSFWNLTQIDLGFRTDHILMGRVRVPLSAIPSNTNPTGNRVIAYTQELLTKVNAVPGVQSAALATNMPLHGNDTFPFSVSGHPVADADRPVAGFEIVTPSYFDTFGVRHIKGRFLNDGDRAGGPQVLMVSQSFAERYLQGQNPLNQHLLLPKIVPGQKLGAPTEWQIVGVFQDIRNGEHLNDKAAPEMIAPFWQVPLPFMGLAVRTSLDPSLISKDIRDAVAQSQPGYSLVNIETMRETVDTQLSGDRFGMILFGGFAALALLLAALGIYGVMAFAVAQRTHEMGLRMALGAQRRDVVLLILRDGMKLALIGLGVGLVGVFVLGHFMSSTLYGVATVDTASLIAVAVTLLAVAVLASYMPARRSAKVDPMVALRQD
jgi:putative ABC transport system permease protein